MKNKITYTLGMAASMMLVFGCSDFLETKSLSDMTKDNYYKSMKDFEGALNANYTSFHQLYNTDIPMLAEAGTDEAFVNKKKKQEKLLDTYTALNSSNEITSSMWRTSYEAINRTNVLRQAMEEHANDDPRYLEIMGENDFLEGLWYFNLVRVFGAVPVKTTASVSSEKFHEYDRDPISVVFKHIFKRLKNAYELLPEERHNNELGRAFKYAASGLLAKAYLHAASSMNNLQPELSEELQLGGLNSYSWKDIDASGNEMTETETMKYYYRKAAEYARITIDYFGGERCLEAGTLIGNFYPKESTRDVLIEAEFAQNTTPNTGAHFGLMFGPDGRVAYGGGFNDIKLNGCIVIPNYVGRYNAKENAWSSQDIRFKWAVSTTEISRQSNQEVVLDGNNPVKVCRKFSINKFRTSLDDIPSHALGSGANCPILRLSDVCLCYSEALAELSWIENGSISDEAIRYLNVVRKNAGVKEYAIGDIREAIEMDFHKKFADIPVGNKAMLGYVATNDIEHFRRTILNERLMELLGESHRWFDLVRMGVLKDVVQAVNDAEVTHNDTGRTTIEDFHVFRPIPYREIQLHHMRLVQNAKYF